MKYNINLDIKHLIKYINNSIILKCLIISLILLVIAYRVSKSIPLSYYQAIESVEVDDEQVIIKFTSRVSNYEVNSFGENHEIMAWNSILNKIFKSSKPKDIVINVNKGEKFSIYYVDQKGDLDKVICSSETKDFIEPRNYVFHGVVIGDSSRGGGHGQVTLPRLAMSYYFTFVLFIFLMLSFLSKLCRKNKKVHKIIDIIKLLPLSYLIGHICILGIKSATYHIERDLIYVLSSSMLIFIIALFLKHKSQYKANEL